MTPALAAFILEEALKNGPEIFAEVKALFAKQTITVEEIETLFNRIKPLSSYNIKVATT